MTIPGMGNPAPASSGKVVDFAAAREETPKDNPRYKGQLNKKPLRKRIRGRSRQAGTAHQRLTRRPLGKAKLAQAGQNGAVYKAPVM